MEEEMLKALLTLSRIKYTQLYRIINEYWSEGEPWWLVRTSAGLLKIGWRKRVINIDWSDTPLREILTQDDVTKEDTLVHAWGYAKAVEYLGVVGYKLDISRHS